MKSLIPTLATLALLGGCTVVSQNDQRADAEKQCAAKGSTFKAVELRGGKAELQHRCANGEFVSVTNLIVGK